jgi:hypothetical protein
VVPVLATIFWLLKNGVAEVSLLMQLSLVKEKMLRMRPLQLSQSQRCQKELLASYNLEDMPCVDLRSRVASLCDRARDSSGSEQGARQNGDDLDMLDCESRDDGQKHPRWKALCRNV